MHSGHPSPIIKFLAPPYLMMLDENTVLARFDSIAKSFSPGERIALCHDLDADGISSGALAYIAVERLRGKGPDLIITQPYKAIELLPKSLAILEKNNINKLIVVDFALDQKPEAIRAVEETLKAGEGTIGRLEEAVEVAIEGGAEKANGQVLVIDHHTLYPAKPSANTFVLKPQLVSEIEPSRYPCAKFVYDLFSRHCDLSSHSWVACVGLIGDNQIGQWKDFVDSECERHVTNRKELWAVMEAISAVEVLAPEKLQELLLHIVRSKSPKDVLSSPFSKYSVRLRKQVDGLFRKFRVEKEAFKDEELVWFAFRAKRSIKSAVINRASNELYPDKTIIFIQDRGDGFVDFSARRQDLRVKTNELLENAVKGFENAGAGGHIPASAGRIMKKDLPEFKRRVLGFLRDGRFRQK